MRKINSSLLLALLCLPLFAIDTLHFDSTTRFMADQVKSLNIIPVCVDTYTFVNDSIIFPRTQSIGKMVYVEHTNDIDKILEYVYPIIMLLLGVAIDRILLHISEQNRIDKAGTLWIIEVENLDYSLQKQIESFKKFISTYCDIDDANDIPPMPKYEVLKCEIFNSFQKKDLYDYLKHKDAATAKDMFHKILNIISTTKDTFEQTLKYFEQSIKESSLHYDAISQYLSDYGQEGSVSFSVSGVSLQTS